MNTTTETGTWTWLVAYGDYRPSVCIERDGEKAAAKFRRKHERYETITRPATRQSRHRDKLAAAGFVQVNVIVPADRAEEIKALAAEMRDAHASVFRGDQ